VIVVLAVRTYAVWGKDKRIGIGLILLFGFAQIPNGMFLTTFIHGIDCEYYVDSLLLFHPVSVSVSAELFVLDIRNPYPEISRGCALASANRLIFAVWVVFTLVEGGTSSVTQFMNLWLIRTGSA